MILAVTTFYSIVGNARSKNFAMLSSEYYKDPKTMTVDEYDAYNRGVIRHSDYAYYITKTYDFGEGSKVAFNIDSTDAFRTGSKGGVSKYISTLDIDDGYIWVSVHMPEITFRVRLEWLTIPKGIDGSGNVIEQSIYIEGAPHFNIECIDYGKDTSCTSLGMLIIATKIAYAPSVVDAFVDAVNLFDTYDINIKDYNHICDIAEMIEIAGRG